MRVSIKEISGKTGYSLATVSNVLNGKAGVNAVICWKKMSQN